MTEQINICYNTSVLNQCLNIKTMCPNYIIEFRNRKSHVLHVYISAQAMIETVIDIQNVTLQGSAMIVHNKYWTVAHYKYLNIRSTTFKALCATTMFVGQNLFLENMIQCNFCMLSDNCNHLFKLQCQCKCFLLLGLEC